MPHPCVILTGWVLACGPDRQRRCGQPVPGGRLWPGHV